MTAKPDLDHLKWAIEQRAEIQRTLLALYKCIERHGLSGGRANPHSLILLNDFVGAAFSLWRAVFLAETFRNNKNIQDNQKSFLEKVIADNAITFSDDKANRYWTVGYYLENARLRLAQACPFYDTHFRSHIGAKLLRWLRLTGHMGVELTRYEWEPVHYVLRALMSALCPEDALQATEPRSVPPKPLERFFTKKKNNKKE